MSGTRCESSTAQRQVTLEHLMSSKITSHSPDQQMGVRNSKGKPAIEDRLQSTAAMAILDQNMCRFANHTQNRTMMHNSTQSTAAMAILNRNDADFQSPPRLCMHARPESTQEQQIITQNHNAHTSMSGELLLHHRNPPIQAQNA